MPVSDSMLRKLPKSICKCCVSTPVAVGFPGAPSREILGQSVLEP
jgi:hypothetical protein